MPRLTVLNEKVALEYTFDRPIRIGRHIANSLPLPDREVSRQHAQIFPRDDRYAISDLGSRNGIYINGKHIKGEQVLNPGDEICVGMTLMFFERPEGGPIKSMLSSRGARIWDDLDRRRELEPAEPTTFSIGELDDMVLRWLHREDSPPLVPHRLRSDLLELALSIGEQSSLTELAEMILLYLHRRLGGDRLVIQVSGGAKKEMKTLASLCEHEKDIKFSKDIIRVAFESERAVFCSSCEEDFRFRHVSKNSDDFQIGSFLAVPMICHGANYGFFYLDHALGEGRADFKSMIHAYMTISLFVKCMHWHHMGLEG
jgi:hypothetical protein